MQYELPIEERQKIMRGEKLSLVMIYVLLVLLFFCIGSVFADVITTETPGTWTLKKGTSNIQTGIASYEVCRAVAQSRATTTAVKYSCNVANILTVKLPNGTATITWVAPTQNTDGTALTDLSGYVLYHNRQNDLTRTELISIPLGTASYVFTGLPPDTHYFSLVAVNSWGMRSEPVMVSKSVQ